MLWSCQPARPSFADNPVVAHRGAWKTADVPENSIAALRQAVALGCTGAEFDVWRTADDTLVIHHDHDFHGMPIEKTTYQELSVWELDNGERLPTLREYVLAGMQGNQTTRLICELKPSTISKARGAETARMAVELVHRLGARAYVHYISFDYDILKSILQIDHQAITQYLNGDKSPGVCIADGILAVDYHVSVFRKHPEWIAQARAEGVMLNTWTVNEPKEMEWLIREKFDFITTNEPELLLEKWRSNQ